MVPKNFCRKLRCAGSLSILATLRTHHVQKGAVSPTPPIASTARPRAGKGKAQWGAVGRLLGRIVSVDMQAAQQQRGECTHPGGECPHAAEKAPRPTALAAPVIKPPLQRDPGSRAVTRWAVAAEAQATALTAPERGSTPAPDRCHLIGLGSQCSRLPAARHLLGWRVAAAR